MQGVIAKERERAVPSCFLYGLTTEPSDVRASVIRAYSPVSPLLKPAWHGRAVNNVRDYSPVVDSDGPDRTRLETIQ